jgi:hypothetical protein
LPTPHNTYDSGEPQAAEAAKEQNMTKQGVFMEKTVYGFISNKEAER